jgi:plastocyanin
MKRISGVPAGLFLASIFLLLTSTSCTRESPLQPVPDGENPTNADVTMSLASGRPVDFSGQTYTVLVGLEQSDQGIDVMAYFPRSVSIHVGDTVHWVLNSNEIHTVTFPDGIMAPDLLLPSDEAGADPAVSPLVFAPFAVQQNPSSGSEFGGGMGESANSGIMGREPGQVQEYDLTFTTENTFGYFCLVHGSAMSGEVIVVGADDAIPSPNQALAEGRRQMAEALSLVPRVVRDAAGQVVPPETNEDGTLTHTILLGYSETLSASYGEVQIDLVQFFPKRLTVRSGDTVTFELSAENVAPHTATFLNGAEEPPLAVSQGGFLYLNANVLFPAGSDVLTRSGVFNSGLLLPGSGASYSLEVGDMSPGLEHFICLLHDGSGMRGELVVVPRPES